MSKNGRLSMSARRAGLAGAGVALASAASLLMPASAGASTAPPAPTNLRVEFTNGVPDVVAWDAVPASGSVSYQLTTGAAGGEVWATSKRSVTMWELVYASCLRQGATYTFYATDIQNQQVSPLSNPVTVTIPDAPIRHRA
jgi:hypothetical protein